MKKEIILKYNIECISKGTKVEILRYELEGAVVYVKVLEGPYAKKNLRVYKSDIEERGIRNE